MEIWCQAAVRSPALSWTLHHNRLVKPFRGGMAEALPGNLFRVEIPTADLKPGFYDVRATCPVFFNGGLVDPVSPAYSTYAAYLRWGGPDKTFVAVPNHGHDWWPAFDRAAYRWLEGRRY